MPTTLTGAVISATNGGGIRCPSAFMTSLLGSGGRHLAPGAPRRQRRADANVVLRPMQRHNRPSREAGPGQLGTFGGPSISDGDCREQVWLLDWH